MTALDSLTVADPHVPMKKILSDQQRRSDYSDRIKEREPIQD